MTLDLIAEQIKNLKDGGARWTAAGVRHDVMLILESMRIVLSQQEARIAKLELELRIKKA